VLLPNSTTGRVGQEANQFPIMTGRAILSEMEKAQSTHERILDQGMALMSQSGIEGVTLGVLADQVGMSKSGLFAHFRSKEEVQINLLEHTAELANARVVAPALKIDKGLPRLKALVANWFGWAPRAGLPGGCPIAAGLFEFDDVEGAVRDKMLELERGWRRVLQQFVRDAVDAGHLDRHLEVDQFVWELSGIYLAHHVTNRFLRSADADRRAQTAFAALLARAMPNTNPKKVRHKK
jgi:AcrR family transcriptional regulator